jgi:Bacteriophage holin family
MKQVGINILLALLAVLAPAKSMVLSSLFLVMLDLVTGLLAAKKQNLPITSSGLRRTISKMLVYESAILLAFLAQQYLVKDIPIANIASSFVGLTELTSCLENIDIISGGGLLKKLISRLGSDNK